MAGVPSSVSEWSLLGLSTWIAHFIGLGSYFASLLSNQYFWDSAKLLLLGSIIETGRRIFRWVIDRFHLQFYIMAEFHSGDLAHDWLVSYLTKENVWRKSRDFLVQSKGSQRKWTVEPSGKEKGHGRHVDYVPAYGSLHFFRWKGYWIEIARVGNGVTFVEEDIGGRYRNTSSLYLTLYTLDMSVLFAFVEECRLKYVESSKPHVTIYSTDSSMAYGDSGTHWNNVKMKHRRPLKSIVLNDGVLDSLLADAREFLEMEDWYITAGIPHRRGYLLYGPPGTGKSEQYHLDGVCHGSEAFAHSSAYFLLLRCTKAGELELDIYSLSLASSKHVFFCLISSRHLMEACISQSIDDSYLTRAVSRLPARGILLIEDIDCAFPSRDDENDSEFAKNSPFGVQKSRVTLSGLLNVLDGIGSEEGKIFFATTNHVDRLDAALMRPGRIDRKFEYKLASRSQAHDLFQRFFPPSLFEIACKVKGKADFDVKHMSSLNLSELADEFASAIPEDEFSTAELQGCLLNYKLKPLKAVQSVSEWVEREREVRRAQAARERERKEKLEAARLKEKLKANEAMIAGIGHAMNQGKEAHIKCTCATAASSTLIEDNPEDVEQSTDRRGGESPGNPSTDVLEDAEPDAPSTRLMVNGNSHSPPESPPLSAKPVTDCS